MREGDELEPKEEEPNALLGCLAIAAFWAFVIVVLGTLALLGILR